MNGAASLVVLALLSCVAECRPVGQGVLAGEDFLAFLMRSHHRRPASPSAYQQPRPPQTTTPATTPDVTTLAATTLFTEAETAAATATPLLPTTLETEPPSVVSVRVSSSVRKEAVPHENSVVPAAATRSQFAVEATGYREAVKEVEDSLAEATQEFHSRRLEEKKPYAEALTFGESGLGYESRVSSETSQSTVYFSRPEPVEETVVVQTSQTRIAVPTQKREERKFVPRYQNEESQLSDNDGRQYSTQSIVSQAREERHYNPHDIVSENRENRQHFSNQQIINQPKEEFESQKLVGRQPHQDFGTQRRVEQYVTQQPMTTGHQQQHDQFGRQQPHQQRQQESYRQPEALTSRNYEEDNRPREEARHYEQPEQNYEVDEAISLMTNGRSHGVQTERPHQQPANKFGLVQEGENYRKYRVEEKTPDGFIVGEYGVVSHDDGGVRGVRYTADGSISPRLIYEALVKFLSLK